MIMEIKEWPIAPTFLCLRKECTEDSANYNTDGIYNPYYIRGFLADLSQHEDIQNALSMFQFVPKDFLPHDPTAKNPSIISTNPKKGMVILNEPLNSKIQKILDGRKIIRIDSGTYVNNGRLCDIFRKCIGNNNFCYQQDSIVGIFADKELNRIAPEQPEYFEKLNSIIKDFNSERENKIDTIIFEPFEEQKRFCLHYTCRYSLFEEHIFPIYLQGRVIACLMLGQIGRDNFDKEKSFSRHRDSMKEKDTNTGEYLDNIRKFNKDEWNKKAKAIIDRIDGFERQLEERIEYKITRYINNTFENIEQNFRKKVKDINIKEQNSVEKFTNILNDAFDAIRNTFDNGNDSFIRMFALPIDIEHDKLVPIGWSGVKYNMQDDDIFALKHLHDIDNLPLEVQRQRIIEAASPKIKSFFNEKKDILLPGWLADKEVAYIVWKRHNEELEKLKNRNFFGNYKVALKKFYSVALECYSYIRGAKMELLLETTMQESAHESAHFILPAIEKVECDFEYVPEYMIIGSYDKFYYDLKNTYERNKQDVLELLNQLRDINIGSSLIYSKDLPLNKKSEKISFLIYKLKMMFEKRSENCHKSIIYEPKILSTLETNIDAKYFNHALYNLLDNAIKYGHEGSFIRINLDVDKRKENMIITITSYGIKIENDDRIYRLFERSADASYIAGGTGIGMYIVKKICKAHNGDITHKSELLCNYNIPVLINYKKNKNLISSIPNREAEIDKALSSLSDEIGKEVVSNSTFVKYSRVFTSRIDTPTFRNIFYMTIPLY